MSTPVVQAVRYVSSNDLVGGFSVTLWDDCPFTVARSEFFPDDKTKVLSLIDIDTFRNWVNEIIEFWEAEGHDVAELRKEFTHACDELADGQVYVNLDSNILIDRCAG